MPNLRAYTIAFTAHWIGHTQKDPRGGGRGIGQVPNCWRTGHLSRTAGGRPTSAFAHSLCTTALHRWSTWFFSPSSIALSQTGQGGFPAASHSRRMRRQAVRLSRDWDVTPSQYRAGSRVEPLRALDPSDKAVATGFTSDSAGADGPPIAARRCPHRQGGGHLPLREGRKMCFGLCG